MPAISPYITAGLVCCFTLFVTTACATKAVSPSPVEYECSRGSMISADFSTDGKYVNISTGDIENLQLPAMPSASGFTYSNGRYELRGKGKEATWSIGRMAAEDCIAK